MRGSIVQDPVGHVMQANSPEVRILPTPLLAWVGFLRGTQSQQGVLVRGKLLAQLLLLLEGLFDLFTLGKHGGLALRSFVQPLEEGTCAQLLEFAWILRRQGDREGSIKKKKDRRGKEKEASSHCG